MDNVIGHVLVAIAGSAFIWFAHWAWKDIKGEKRPEVTEDMVDDAFNRMLEDNGYILDD